MWDFFQQGCSIRLLNPQTYSKNIWKYLSLLQELFGTCVGSNVYLTPAGTQGFAPHYDDIEAFVLQLEGKKRWRVYKPRNEEEKLSRFSSVNFSQAELPEPIIDVVLEPGDLLYFPRGFPHQANALDDIHSLHITVSCYQKNSWGDYLLKLLPVAIENAMAENVEFREGLPINYLMHHGVAFEGDKKPSKDRIQFRDKCEKLVKKLVKYMPIDGAVDQMAKNYLHESLPPCFTEGCAFILIGFGPINLIEWHQSGMLAFLTRSYTPGFLRILIGLKYFTRSRRTHCSKLKKFTRFTKIY